MSETDAEAFVSLAYRTGYRYFDTASYYKNEAGVATGLRVDGVDPSTVAIQTKIWNDDRGYDKVTAAVRRAQEKLGCETLDSVLLHWPANRRQFSDEADDINRASWKALVDLQVQGVITTIGVSNFLPDHIEALKQTSPVLPAINQIEFHLGWTQDNTRAYCRENGILVQAWAPLARGDVREDKVVKKIAEDHAVTWAQVCLRWCLQHGAMPLPKASSPERMRENLDVFGFELNGLEMALLDDVSDLADHHLDPEGVDF
jgi:diketogulonate reductase-like aldo/keto reductase